MRRKGKRGKEGKPGSTPHPLLCLLSILPVCARGSLTWAPTQPPTGPGSRRPCSSSLHRTAMWVSLSPAAFSLCTVEEP